MEGSQTNGSQSSKIDWIAMEPEFINSGKSLRALGEKYGCSDTAIRKHFKKLEVKRDPSARIKAKAADKVRKQEVRKQVLNDTRLTEKKVIEVAAQVEADLIMSHRKDARKTRGLINKIKAKLEDLVDNEEVLEQIIKNLESNKTDKAADAIHKIASLPIQVKMVKDLVSALKEAIVIERQAFGIVDDVAPENELAAFIKSISGGSLPITTGDNQDD